MYWLSILLTKCTTNFYQILDAHTHSNKLLNSVVLSAGIISGLACTSVLQNFKDLGAIELMFMAHS